ncbi:ArnT family glycosyltransferase [Petrachloros mirabilis]
MAFASHASPISSPCPARLRFLESHVWYLVLFTIIVRLLAAVTFPLFYKEAYFWEWSHFLSLGYLDHPPMVAWTIKTFSLLFPDHWLLTIRSGALLFGAASLLLIYQIAMNLFGERTVAERALVLALAFPLLHAVGTLMTPDAPLVFFYLLSLRFFTSAVRSGRGFHWYLFGAAMGLALLSKLMAIPSLIALGLFLFGNQASRHWLKRKEPYLALGVAFAVFLPFVIWNGEHDWASFKMQFWDRHIATWGFGFGKASEFCFEQLINSLFLLVPIVACLITQPQNIPTDWKAGFQLLRYQILTTLAFFFVVGAVTETHPHWTVLAYPPAAIALSVWWSREKDHPVARSMNWLTPLALAMVFLVITLVPLSRPILMSVPTVGFGDRWEKKISTARMRLFGWPEIVTEIDRRLRQVTNSHDTDDGVVFASNYKQSSMLSFYRSQGMTLNLQAYLRSPKNVGDAAWYYQPQSFLQGKSGVFVTDGSGPDVPELRRLFRSVRPLPSIEKHAANQLIGQYRIYRVEGFQPGQSAQP